MRQLARDLGVAEFVSFTGRVPDAELLEMLNTADICVNPDRANDMNDRSTMNKVMEYMALGKPLVQFDLTEGRVSAGEASWYARPNDVADLAQKIVALLADEQQRTQMSAVGRERIEHLLSWQHEQPRLLAAYDYLIHKTGLLKPSGERQ
jgi:glycosyltransferase involved in cell wall biosynthesis